MSMAPCQSTIVQQAHVGLICIPTVTRSLRHKALPILNSLEATLIPGNGSSAPSLGAMLRVDHLRRIFSGRPPCLEVQRRMLHPDLSKVYQSPGPPSNGERKLVGMSRVSFEEPHSGTQHHVAAFERTLGLIDVIITSSLQKTDFTLLFLLAHRIITLLKHPILRTSHTLSIIFSHYSIH